MYILAKLFEDSCRIIVLVFILNRLLSIFIYPRKEPRMMSVWRCLMLVVVYYVSLVLGFSLRRSIGFSPRPRLALSYSYSSKDAIKGGRGGKILFCISVALLLRSQFSSVELRTTTVCPTGDKAGNTIRIFMENDPDFHCLPLSELVTNFFTSPFVFPGDPEFDTDFITGPRGLKMSRPISRHL